MSGDQREIVSVRVFDAPREAVFEAIADPERLARWWGPHGFTSAFTQFDFRPGGAWRFTMRGPDGVTYAMDKQFVEIVRPERIVVRHFQQGHDHDLTMSLRDLGGQTELHWLMRFASVEEAEAVRAVILGANEQNFDRLAAEVARNG